MRALRLLVPLGVAALTSCSGTPAGSALQVQVVLAAGTTSRCVQVLADDGTRQRASGPILVEGRSLLRVAVHQDDFVEPVLLEAVGYADDGCTTPSTPAERSERAEGFFTAPLSTVTLTLRPVAGADAGTDGGAGDDGGTDAGTIDDGGTDAGAGDDAGTPDAGSDAGVDQDNDGYSPPADCNDLDPQVHPDAGERCTGGVDDDCDSLIDCADPGCLNQACGTNGTCLANGTCQSPVETGLCVDGVDNDTDGLIDCADPDCPAGVACSDSNACTLADVCGGDAGCVSGSTMVCQTPPAQCFASAGACLPDAGACAYAVRTGSCDDGLGCTTVDTCLADGGCAGAAVACTTPPGQCHAAQGACAEPAGTCTYSPLPTGACSDGDNCTVNDTCDGDGGCAGTTVTCTAPDQCLATTGTCDADGGCLFAPRTGQACDGGTGAGTCSDAGACVLPQPPIFPYVPSNFTESQLPANGGAMTFNCGTTTLDTRAADGGIAWTNLCGAISPPAFAVVSVGGQEALLLFAESLSVPSGNTLRAVGQRPLILAVRTGASIEGTVDVTSDHNAARGAGANLDCGAAGVGGLGGNGGVVSNRSGGGGGAGFGLDGADGAQGNGGGAGGVRGKTMSGPSLVPLRGGCPGGNGGRATGNDGIGGFGGGALQLSVAGALTLTGSGRVSVSGGGGRGGPQSGSNGEGLGGGGGGSGGGLLLEAATVSLTTLTALTANGGGGGEGAGVTSDGDDGANGSISAGTNAAGGANGSTCGGNGGFGGALAGASAGSQETCTTSNSGSGGGGGGAAGRIRVNASTSCSLLGTVSPLPSGNGSTGCPAP